MSAQGPGPAKRKLCQNTLDLQASTAITVPLDVAGGAEPQDLGDA